MQTGADQVASRGTAGPSALAVLRAAWRCDCDGVSHRASAPAPSGTAATVKRYLDVIQSVTGHRPPTCPWRALYDPLVSRAIDLSIDSDGGYVMATLGQDPPQLLTDALRTFRVSRGAGERHVRRVLEEKNKRKGPPRGSGGGGGFVSMRRRRRKRG